MGEARGPLPPCFFKFLNSGVKNGKLHVNLLTYPRDFEKKKRKKKKEKRKKKLPFS